MFELCESDVKVVVCLVSKVVVGGVFYWIFEFGYDVFEMFELGFFWKCDIVYYLIF